MGNQVGNPCLTKLLEFLERKEKKITFGANYAEALGLASIAQAIENLTKTLEKILGKISVHVEPPEMR